MLALPLAVDSVDTSVESTVGYLVVGKAAVRAVGRAVTMVDDSVEWMAALLAGTTVRLAVVTAGSRADKLVVEMAVSMAATWDLPEVGGWVGLTAVDSVGVSVDWLAVLTVLTKRSESSDCTSPWNKNHLLSTRRYSLCHLKSWCTAYSCRCTWGSQWSTERSNTCC